jgi:Fe2+ or Zn2+ uptake regulation protein
MLVAAGRVVVGWNQWRHAFAKSFIAGHTRLPPFESQLRTCRARTLSLGSEKRSTARKNLSTRTATTQSSGSKDSTETLLQLPLGQWTHGNLQSAQTILNNVVRKRERDRLQPLPRASEVNGFLSLLERLVEEVASRKEHGETTPNRLEEWLGKSRHLLNPLCSIWKEAYLEVYKSDLVSPTDLIRRLQHLSIRLPSFAVCIVTYNIIASVDIKAAHGNMAATVAEKWLTRIHKAQRANKHQRSLHPTVVTYNMVLVALATSKTAVSATRIKELTQKMQQHGVSWDKSTYRTLVQFWASQGNVEEVVSILDKLRCTQQETLDSKVLVCAIRLLVNQGQMIRAEEYLQQLVRCCSAGEDADGICHSRTAESVHHMLNGYRNKVASESLNRYQRAEAMECAEALVRRLESSSVLSTDSLCT